MLVSILMLAMLTTQTSDESNKVKTLPEIAIENCRHVNTKSSEKRKEALEVAKILYDVEQDNQVPQEMRGMILAAACLESGYSITARGDRKFSKNKKKPMAIGVLQMWPWYEKAYNVDRSDPRSSATGWIKHIKRQVPRVKKMCRYRTLKRVWTAAWVTGIRYKKPGGRCKERPKHYRFFKKIRKIYESQIKMSSTKSGKTE